MGLLPDEAYQALEGLKGRRVESRCPCLGGASACGLSALDRMKAFQPWTGRILALLERDGLRVKEVDAAWLDAIFGGGASVR